MISDFKFALRQLAKAPGFSATVILTLALGIGACTVIFTVVNSTLLEVVRGTNLDGMVIIHETRLPQTPQMQLSPPAFIDLEREAKSFEFLTAWSSATINLTGDLEPQRLSAALLTPRTLDTWGMKPAVGRIFSPDEYVPGKNNVALLSFSLWQRAFGGDRKVVGRTVLFDDQPFTIVGVMSERFAQLGSDLEVFLPLVFNDSQRLQQRGSHYLQTSGRLKSGVTLAQAQAELDVFAARYAQQYPDTNKGVGLLVRDLNGYINRTLKPMLRILLGTVVCVLLISCANVANLLLARATVRQREISIRVALGASRARIVTQLLVESVVLALIGGGAGVLLAQWGLASIRTFAPAAGTDFARLAYVHLDGRMLAFALGFSVVTGLVFGLAPAWLSSRVDLNEALKQGSRGATDSRSRGRLRNSLAALEIALAVVLLAGAGLLVRSFAELGRIDPGFVPERAVTMRIFLRNQKYRTPEQRAGFADAALERLRSLPGVEAAAFTTTTPFNNPGSLSFNVVGRPPAESRAQPTAALLGVSSDYFRALGIRLSRGRVFNDRDVLASPRVVVINETLAKQFFAGDDPLGKQITFPNGPPGSHEIVGIVPDVMQGAPGLPPVPQLYISLGQYPSTALYGIVRVTGDPLATLPLVKPQIYAVDKDQPITAVRLLEDLFGDALARQRFMLNLLSVFAVIALVISAIGLYGVMAYSVSQRTAEFGIRLALGATPANIFSQVLRQGMSLLALGLIAGLVVTFLFGEFVQSLLYHTSPRDPLTLVVIAVTLTTVTFLACLVPARRATKVDPMVALRAE